PPPLCEGAVPRLCLSLHVSLRAHLSYSPTPTNALTTLPHALHSASFFYPMSCLHPGRGNTASALAVFASVLSVGGGLVAFYYFRRMEDKRFRQMSGLKNAPVHGAYCVQTHRRQHSRRFDQSDMVFHILRRISLRVPHKEPFCNLSGHGLFRLT